MKIYLLKNIPNLGNKGEIKNVADGYAINYLFPQKIAQRADLNVIKKVSLGDNNKIIMEQEKKEQALKLSRALKKVILEIPLKFAAKGKDAYDSVNSKRIIEELDSQDIHLSESQIQLKRPLKKEGLYKVNLMLYPEVEALLKIRISLAVAQENLVSRSAQNKN